ncbi:MAG: metallophosphoesterase [Chthoniobacterales bacterium]
MNESRGDSLTRREWLRLSAGAGTLLSLGLWPGRLRGEDAPATDDFTFIAVNDLHALEPTCRPWFDQVVRQMKASAPTAEFCLLGGDQADEGTAAQLTLIKESFSALGIACHAVVGNHDYRSDTDRSAYERIFPEQINYTFTHRGWQIIGLDSSEGTKSQETRISATTLNWLDQNVSKLDAKRPTILFTHFPLGDFVVARPINADDLLKRCYGLNLQAVFCGHFHGFTERSFRNAIITTDKCCSRIRLNHDGTPEKGWFVCQAANGEIKRRFVEFHPTA